MSEGFSPFPWDSAPQPWFAPAPEERRPFSLGFFSALGWCIVFVLCTQIPGVFVAAAFLIVIALAKPELIPRDALDPSAVMSSPGVNLSMMAALGFNQIMVIGFSLGMIWFLIGPDWRRQLSLRLPAGRHVLLVLAAFPAMWLLADFSYGLLLRVLPSMKDLFQVPGMEEMTEVFAHWPWPLAILIIGVGPGIGEELWCRGFLGRGLVNRYGAILGVLFTSFFFGLIHVDPCQGAMAMLLGLWLHYTYLTTRSLCVPMLLHFLNNSLSVLAPRWSALQLLDEEIVQPSQGSVILALAALLLLFLVGWALYQSRVRLGDRAGVSSDRPVGEMPAPESGLLLIAPPLRLGTLLAVLVGAAVFGGILAWALWAATVGTAG